MSDNVEKLLNPEVRALFLGVKDVETIQVYPLTYNDQKSIGNKVVASVKKIAAETEGTTELDYLGQVTKVLESNVPLLIAKCTDKTKKEFMEKVTAGQLVEFITTVMEVNFLNPIRRGTELFVEMGSLYATNQSSPPSAEPTAINSEISPLHTEKAV